MKNKKLFNETIDILVKAYMNGTLNHLDCTACAVGNIVAKKYYGISGCIKSPADAHWFSAVFSSDKKRLSDLCVNQINSTGYSISDVVEIEDSFEEGADFLVSMDKDGYKGLMAVVGVLCKIHECEDIKEDTKQLFKAVQS
jgi:hypothetical protein